MAKVSKTVQPKYTPEKAYSWKPEDSFEISGLDFDFLLKYFSAEVNSPTGVAPVDKMRGYTMMQELLKTAVEQGVAKEVVSDTEDFVETTD